MYLYICDIIKDKLYDKYITFCFFIGLGVKFLKGNIYLKSYLIICLTSTLILIGIGFIMKSFFYESKIQSYKTKAEQVLAGIAYNIDVDKIIKYKSSLKMDDEYKEIVRERVER